MLSHLYCYANNITSPTFATTSASIYLLAPPSPLTWVPHCHRHCCHRHCRCHCHSFRHHYCLHHHFCCYCCCFLIDCCLPLCCLCFCRRCLPPPLLLFAANTLATVSRPWREWGVLATLDRTTKPSHSATLPLLVKFDVQKKLHLLSNILSMFPPPLPVPAIDTAGCRHHCCYLLLPPQPLPLLLLPPPLPLFPAAMIAIETAVMAAAAAAAVLAAAMAAVLAAAATAAAAAAVAT